jgi:hypothetical protein
LGDGDHIAGGEYWMNSCGGRKKTPPAPHIEEILEEISIERLPAGLFTSGEQVRPLLGFFRREAAYAG